MRAILATALLCVLAAPALARDNGQWEGSPAATRQWFQSLMQPDITDGKGVLPAGTRIPVPNHKMKWDQGNPTGHGIVFIGSTGQVYCYVAPGGV